MRSPAAAHPSGRETPPPKPPGARWTPLRAAAVLLAVALPLIGGAPSRAVGAGPAAPLVQAPDGRRLALTFSRTFSDPDSAPDRDRTWRTTYGVGQDDGPSERSIPSSGEQQLYVDPQYAARIGAAGLDPFSIRNGVLEINAAPAQPALIPALEGRRYTSGVMTTQPTFSQLYGYFEVRAKLPNGKGLWPAIWLLPADNTWPPEIDIMESIGDPYTIYTSLHSAAAPTFSKQIRVGGDGFHTFAVSWDSRQVVWYVDGSQVASAPTPADMHKPMFLIVNLAVGGTWPGMPDSSTVFPAKFSIAYVRSYRFA